MTGGSIPANDQSPPIPVAAPVGDPNVIRVAQQFLELAQRCNICGLVAVGVDANGNVMSSQAVPGNPTLIQVMMGALQSSMFHLYEILKTMMQKAPVSPIIRPRGMMS